MRHAARLRNLATAIGLIAMVLGCSQAQEKPAAVAKKKIAPKSTEQPSDAVDPNPAKKPSKLIRDRSKAPAALAPIPADLAEAKVEMPRVLLSDGHKQTCLVKVGDSLPELKLTNLEGETTSLSTLMGKRLTVLCFWTTSQPFALEELGDLAPNVAAPFGGLGVQVVAVNYRDSADAVRQAVAKAGVEFPVLLDTNGTAFALLATQKLPRTYVLDPAGKILWFDIEYSRSTRRDLLAAIQSTLSTQTAAAPTTTKAGE